MACPHWDDPVFRSETEFLHLGFTISFGGSASLACVQPISGAPGWRAHRGVRLCASGKKSSVARAARRASKRAHLSAMPWRASIGRARLRLPFGPECNCAQTRAILRRQRSSAGARARTYQGAASLPAGAARCCGLEWGARGARRLGPRLLARAHSSAR
eukprot:6808189-Pyramimonas_sp.AAC.1